MMTIRQSIIVQVLDERRRQDEKFGPVQFADNDAAWNAAVLTEELGEIAQAVLKGDKQNLREELIQLTACGLAWLEALVQS